ncbi:MAG: hypothetical protein N2B58_07015, partial [Desulfobacterales bacterium]
VQEEAMAPARMVAFMEKHIAQCEECLADPDVKQEADKIREIVLPPPKALKPKVARVPKEDVEDADAVAETEDETSEDETAEDEDEDTVETDEDEVEDNNDKDDEDDDDFDSVDIMADDEI